MSKIKLGVGGANASYSGKSPFCDVLAFGSAVGAVILGLTYGCLWIGEHFYEKKAKFKKKLNNDKDSNPKPADKDPADTPKDETLNQTCNKPHEDFDKMRLVGDLIFKGDSIILYSSDGEGKSLLAMAVCIDIAGGYMTSLLPDCNLPDTPPAPQRVFYYDAELNDEDIQMRYGGNGHVFPENLIRVSSTFGSVKQLFSDIEGRVAKATSDVTICIDNLSAIIPPTSPQSAREFFLSQKSMKEKAKARGISVTVLTITHTTKTSPGQVNENFYGSAHIGNLAATRIGLFPTRYGEEYKMLKVQKNRKFGKDDNVIVVKRVQSPYPHFEYCDTMPLEDALPSKKSPRFNGGAGILIETPSKPAPNQKIDEKVEQKMKELFEQGIKPSVIARKLHLSEKTIRRKKKELGFSA